MKDLHWISTKAYFAKSKTGEFKNEYRIRLVGAPEETVLQVKLKE